MRYVKAALGFTIGGLAVVAAAIAIQVYLGGYTYRNTPPIGNLVFGIVIYSPYVLCGSLGFAFGSHLFDVIVNTTRSLIVGAAFVATMGVLTWAINKFIRFNPFGDEMGAFGALTFAIAILSALLPRALARSTK